MRKVDELGRINIPMEMRRMFGINIKDEVEIFISGDAVILQKYNAACIFCGSTDGVSSFSEKYVCLKCVKEMKHGE